MNRAARRAVASDFLRKSRSDPGTGAAFDALAKKQGRATTRHMEQALVARRSGGAKAAALDVIRRISKGKESMTTDRTQEQRAGNILCHLKQGTLLRHEWGNGHTRACLLAAMAPEVIHEGSGRADPQSCPADVMPAWMAELTPALDDLGTDDAWKAMVERYALVASRWTALSPKAWERLRLTAAKLVVECSGEAESTIGKDVMKMLDAVLDGRQPPEQADISKLANKAAYAGLSVSCAALMEGRVDAPLGPGSLCHALNSVLSRRGGPGINQFTDKLLTAIEAECTLAEQAG